MVLSADRDIILVKTTTTTTTQHCKHVQLEEKWLLSLWHLLTRINIFTVALGGTDTETSGVPNAVALNTRAIASVGRCIHLPSVDS